MIKKYLIIILLIFYGCSPNILKKPSNKTNLSFDSSDDITLQNNNNNNIAPGIVPQNKISSSEINGIEFKINNIQINKQIFQGYSQPVITYIKPEKVGYIEFLRCHLTLNLLSASGKSLTDVLAATDQEQMKIDMITGDFWNKAVSSSQCYLVGYAYKSHSLFVDYTAKTGGFYYLIRGCVLAENILDLPVIGINNCSVFVSKSMELNYTNDRDQTSLQQLVDKYQLIANYQSNIHRMSNLAIRALEEMEKCNTKEAARQIAVRKKSAIAALAGSVLGFACALPSDVEASKLLGSKLLGRTNAALSNADFCADTISSMIDNFSSHPDDYPRSCTEGFNYYRQSIPLSLQIKDQALSLLEP